MRNVFPKFLQFLVLAPLILNAQDSLNIQFLPVEPPCQVNQIVIVGNKHTRDKVIKRVVDFERGSVMTKEIMSDIRNQILSLNLFTRVNTTIETIKNDTILFIEVEELVYIFPYPYFRIVDQDWSKLNIGLGFANTNLWGLNQRLYAVGWLGYDPGFSINYLNPWWGNNGFLYGASIFRTNITNRIFPFDETHFGGSLTMGKNLSIYSKLTVKSTFDHIDLSSGSVFYAENTENSDLLMKFEGNFQIDRRNNRFYPLKGYFLNLQYYYATWHKQHQRYHNMSLDLRYFHQTGSFSTFGIRTLGVRRSSQQPVSDFLLLGYEYRIRGYFNLIKQGIWLNITTLSYRFPLIPIKLFNFPAIFGMSKSLFRNVPLGLSMAVYAETGFLVDKIKKMKSTDLLSGYGIGFIAHMPYVNVMRFDIAVNDKFDNIDFIFLIGTAF